MKRDIRLRGLTSDHHHALVLVRRIRDALASGVPPPALLEQVHEAYVNDLRPHFEVEESLLLPALDAAGEGALVRRTLTDHEQLRGLVAAVGRGQAEALAGFATLLERHVRFEERELFEVCQQRLPGPVLDQVAVSAPKKA